MTACNDFAYDFGDDCFVYDVVYNFDFLKGYFIFTFLASLVPLFEAVDYFTNLGRVGEIIYLFDVMTACNDWFDCMFWTRLAWSRWSNLVHSSTPVLDFVA